MAVQVLPVGQSAGASQMMYSPVPHVASHLDPSAGKTSSYVQPVRSFGVPCPQQTLPVAQFCGASHSHVAPALGDVVGQVAVLAMQLEAGVEPEGVSQQNIPGSQVFDEVPPSAPVPAPGQNTPEKPPSVAVGGCSVGSLPQVPPPSLASPLVASSVAVSVPSAVSVLAESPGEASALESVFTDESVGLPPVSAPGSLDGESLLLLHATTETHATTAKKLTTLGSKIIEAVYRPRLNRWLTTARAVAKQSPVTFCV